MFSCCNAEEQPTTEVVAPPTASNPVPVAAPAPQASAPAAGGKSPPEGCTVSCLCGACVLECTGVPKWVCNCHCSQCRRTLSASYATLCGFDPENVKFIKGENNVNSHTTGKEERLTCSTCGGKVLAILHHLNHKAIYTDMFTSPNHGPDGKLAPGFQATMHIMYPSGNTNIRDGLPKYVDLPAAFGGSDKQVPDIFHWSPTVEVPNNKCVARCFCGECEVQTTTLPKWVVNCHCSQCRRTLSASYATLAGFDPDALTVTKGQANLQSYTTGKEERLTCKKCGSKVYGHLHHLNHKCIYLDQFVVPNHGADGKIAKGFAPTMHIFYPSGTTALPDGLPKYKDLPAAFGGSDQKVPEPPAAVPPGALSIKFQQGSIDITQKPLGVTFTNTMPLAVKSVEEGLVADKAGVQPGWVFTSIAGKPVGDDFQAAQSLLKDSMGSLSMLEENAPSQALPIKFLLPNGFVKKVNFTKKPLGMKFDKTVPLTVKSCVDNSHASELAVQPGWVFKNVGGTDITPKHTADDIIKMISTGSQSLP